MQTLTTGDEGNEEVRTTTWVRMFRGDGSCNRLGGQPRPLPRVGRTGGNLRAFLRARARRRIGSEAACRAVGTSRRGCRRLIAPAVPRHAAGPDPELCATESLYVRPETVSKPLERRLAELVAFEEQDSAESLRSPRVKIGGTRRTTGTIGRVAVVVGALTGRGSGWQLVRA